MHIILITLTFTFLFLLTSITSVLILSFNLRTEPAYLSVNISLVQIVFNNIAFEFAFEFEYNTEQC